MKISYISGSTLPSKKANAVHVMKMCQALSRHKKSTVTLYGKRGSWLKDAYAYYDVKQSFQLVRSWFGTIPFLSGILRIVSVFVHAGFLNKSDAYYGRDAMGLLLLSLFGKPLFYESHQVPQGRLEVFIVSSLLKRPSFKGVVVISKGLEKDFLEHFPFYKGSITVAHDGADIPTKTPNKIPQKTWAGRKDILQVGYVGSLHKGKGMELIYDIAQLVPEIDFHVVGGTQDDQTHWREKGLPKNLHMHGSKPHSEVPAYLAKFDVVLAPYQSQISIGSGADIARWISPMKLFEYMAAQKPIICSDIPVLHEIMQHGRNGLMASPDDPTTWVDALCNLEKSSDYRESLAKEGFKDIQDHYSWNIRADRILALIKGGS